MKTKKTIFYMLAIILGGCLQSLHPLYTDKDLIFEEKLIGKWSGEESIWEFRQGEGKAYKMRVLDGKEAWFIAHLAKFEDMMFLDIFPDGKTLEDTQGFYKMHLLGLHTFMKVEQIEPTLQLRKLDYEKVSDMLKEDPNLLKHEIIDDRLVLTAPTKQLQEFMVKYANEEGVFNDTTEFTRREPLYTDQDLIFDENLIGQWEGKNGEILDSIRMEEKAYEMMYDMIFVDQDGTEYHCIANLVKLKETMFLAVFFDKSSFDDEGSYGAHLIPDYLEMVEQVEPKLLLRHIDYEEVAEMLKGDTESLKQETTDADYTFEGIRVQL
jgi:hypothetical protein